MGAAESRALLMGGMKRASSVEDPRDDKKAKVEKTKVLDIQDFNVGIEIETCCNQIPYLQYFKQEKDQSIQCLEGNEVEFVLRYDNRKYFQQRLRIMHEMDNIVTACRMCAPSNNNPKHTTCGVHIHLSHPLATKREYAQFDRYFSRYWMFTLYDALRQTYNLRLYNTYCRKNICYIHDRHDKYRQLNLSPTSEEDDDLWHFEFRGMDDIHRVDVATVDKFIHALANGYKMAFDMYNHKPAPDNYDWKEELWQLLYETEKDDGPPIEWVSELITEARAAGSPIDLDAYDDDVDNVNLDQILYRSSYGNISDVPHLKKILSQAKNYDPYFDKDDNEWYSPLFWITHKDGKSKGYEMSLALLPFLKEKGYTISSRVINELPKPVVTAWGPISFDWKKELEALFKFFDIYDEGPPIEEVSKLLTEARAAGSPIDLDAYDDDVDNVNLNSILCSSSYGDISDVPHLKDILSQAKNWDAYFDKDDNEWYSPLSWITHKDGKSKGYEMSLALLPFLNENGYTISSRVINELPKPVVTAWNAL